MVRNEGDRPVGDAIVVVALFDAEGRVSGYAQVPVSAPLPPGAEIPFAAQLVPPGAVPVTVRAAAYGLLAAEAE
jgi:hypothetical protein